MCLAQSVSHPIREEAACWTGALLPAILDRAFKEGGPMTRKQTDEKAGRQDGASPSDAPRCGLCGKQGNLTRTECCGQWICDDEHTYQLRDSHKSCQRNHHRMTLCGFHHGEGHEGDWKTCATCRDAFETEMYVWYGTNEYNFEKLADPPLYEPTHCDNCGAVVSLALETYTKAPEGILCEKCARKGFRRPLLRR